MIVRASVNPIAVSRGDPGAAVHQPKLEGVDGLAAGVGPTDGFQRLGEGEGLVVDEVKSLFRVWVSRVHRGEDGAGGGHHPIREVRLPATKPSMAGSRWPSGATERRVDPVTEIGADG